MTPLFVPHGQRCEADDGRGPDFGRCAEPAEGWVLVKGAPYCVCAFHAKHWRGDQPAPPPQEKA